MLDRGCRHRVVRRRMGETQFRDEAEQITGGDRAACGNSGRDGEHRDGGMQVASHLVSHLVLSHLILKKRVKCATPTNQRSMTDACQFEVTRLGKISSRSSFAEECS